MCTDVHWDECCLKHGCLLEGLDMVKAATGPRGHKTRWNTTMEKYTPEAQCWQVLGFPHTIMQAGPLQHTDLLDLVYDYSIFIPNVRSCSLTL